MNASPPAILAGSFWNFAGVLDKVWRCAWGLAVILRLIFVTLFSQSLLAQLLPKHIDTWYLRTQLVVQFYPGLFFKLCRFFVKVWRCAWCLAVILRLLFVTFLHFELSHFLAQLLLKHIDTGYLRTQFLLQFYPALFNLCMCFCQGLKMRMSFGCYPQINFVNLFRSLNLVIFGSTSTKAYSHRTRRWSSGLIFFYSRDDSSAPHVVQTLMSIYGATSGSFPASWWSLLRLLR